MEVLGAILLICMVMLFGVAAFATAFETRERKRLDKHKVKHTDKDNT